MYTAHAARWSQKSPRSHGSRSTRLDSSLGSVLSEALYRLRSRLLLERCMPHAVHVGKLELNFLTESGL